MAAAAAAISPAQITVLRKLVHDSEFRRSFFADPIKAVGPERHGLAPAELGVLMQITPTTIDGLQRAAKAVGQSRADDNCTLVYALAFAVAFALL